MGSAWRDLGERTAEIGVVDASNNGFPSGPKAVSVETDRSAHPGEHVGEFIPWEHLTTSPPRDWAKLFYRVAGALLVVAVVLLAAQRIVARPTPLNGEIDSRAPATALGAVVEETITPGAESVVLPQPESGSIISEADLMAVDTSEVRRALAARAEWVVLEYFSLDPGVDWSARVSEAGGISVPANARPKTQDQATVSYVEWVAIEKVAWDGCRCVHRDGSHAAHGGG